MKLVDACVNNVECLADEVSNFESFFESIFKFVALISLSIGLILFSLADFAYSIEKIAIMFCLNFKGIKQKFCGTTFKK
jgi:hypothetical protein